MKKLFYYVAIMAALVLTSCSNGMGKLPDDLRALIEKIDKDFDENSKGDEECEYKGVKVEDHDIIFTLQFTEKYLNGKTLQEKTKENGFDSKRMTRQLRSGWLFIGVVDTDELIKLLCKYEYNLVFRGIGKNSDDIVDSRISYKDLMEDEKEEYDAEQEKTEMVCSHDDSEEDSTSRVEKNNNIAEQCVREVEAAKNLKELEKIIAKYSDLDGINFTKKQQARLETALRKLYDSAEDEELDDFIEEKTTPKAKVNNSRTEQCVREIEAAKSIEEVEKIASKYSDLDDDDFTEDQRERMEEAFLYLY